MNWQLWVAVCSASSIASVVIVHSVSLHDSDAWFYRYAWLLFGDFGLVELMACLVIVAALFDRNSDNTV
jgi:hypothetical protein